MRAIICVDCSAIVERARTGRKGERCADCNVAHAKKRALAYREANRAKILEGKKKDYLENREKRNVVNREWALANPEKVKKAHAAWLTRNADLQRHRSRVSARKHAAKALEKRRANLGYRIHHAMSSMVSSGITDKRKRTWISLVPYTVADLMAYIESLFKPGMSWNNYGRLGWHIDHIVPRTAFKFISADDLEFQECWALRNLQPLWYFENISKGNRRACSQWPRQERAIAA